MEERFICYWVVVMKVYLVQVLREHNYDWWLYRVLQSCADVPEPVSGSCTETSLTACNMKVEEFSDMPEEEDPLAVTSPAAQAEQTVNNVCITRWC
jgi:hypothetical protein